MKIDPPEGGFHGPVKRSITIAGHQTSISLEPIFWEALEAAAADRGLPLSALVAAIDHARISTGDPPNLASAIRTWLMDALNADMIATKMRTVRISVDSENASQ